MCLWSKGTLIHWVNWSKVNLWLIHWYTDSLINCINSAIHWPDSFFNHKFIDALRVYIDYLPISWKTHIQISSPCCWCIGHPQNAGAEDRAIPQSRRCYSLQQLFWCQHWILWGSPRSRRCLVIWWTQPCFDHRWNSALQGGEASIHSPKYGRQWLFIIAYSVVVVYSFSDNDR